MSEAVRQGRDRPQASRTALADNGYRTTGSALFTTHHSSVQHADDA